MQPMVTGEGVQLELQVAQLPVRAAGALIDIITMLTAYLVAVLAWAMTLGQFDEALSAGVLVTLGVSVQVGYPVVFETATRGRSLGKIAMGLRVVSDDGGPERFRQALFRALAGVVEIWALAGSPAIITSLVSGKGKRIGDIFAGTMVISERTPTPAAPPLMPPMLGWWAQSLQLTGLKPEDAELARQFLSRAPQLDVRLRDAIAYRVATQVFGEVTPPPPPGTPPQVALAAVLAERHRRELLRAGVSSYAAPHAVPAAHWPTPTAGTRI